LSKGMAVGVRDEPQHCQSALKSIQETASKNTQGSGGLFSLFEAVGVIPGFENIAVVGETVEERRGHFGVPQNLYPFAKAEVRGDDQRGFFIEMAAQVEE